MDFAKDHLSTLLFQVATLEKSYIDKQVKKANLNIIQAKSLYYIHLHPQLIQKELAEYLDKPHATTSNIVTSLENKGYLYRKQISGNEQKKYLFLTPQGEKLAKEIQFIFDQLEEIVTNNLSLNEKKGIQELLKRIHNNLQEQK
ncbi:MarR family winged helix-turn-helix transcriptional regulator [Aerococcus urinae]|uniref:MarR family winged helix-turn-helix transcriptional regulator n=1 Tax=Aerococcus mictus TaxID=2976810 RepID=UPI00124947E9|nr:MarR family transcriptional regulator [Aerococcus mictus]KAA9233275.1 MarR family transcriptional regulator [Aerococcus mictus]